MLEAASVGTSETTGATTVQGVFQVADSPNANRRVYPFDILLAETKRLQEICKVRGLFGELDHPWYSGDGAEAEAAIIHAKTVSHLITALWNEGKIFYGKLELLDTPMGLILQEIINKKCQIGVSSRSLGGVRSGANGFSYVEADGFRIISFDAVIGPSVVESKLQTVRAMKEWSELSGALIKETTEEAKQDIRKDIRKMIRQIMFD
jgi:hypothetical protein